MSVSSFDRLPICYLSRNLVSSLFVGYSYKPLWAGSVCGSKERHWGARNAESRLGSGIGESIRRTTLLAWDLVSGISYS